MTTKQQQHRPLTLENYDSGDRVSASSGIASANSMQSMPWLEEPEDVNQVSYDFRNSKRCLRSQKRSKGQSPLGSSSSNSPSPPKADHKSDVVVAPSGGIRAVSVTPSMATGISTCPTEITDCPSEMSSFASKASTKKLNHSGSTLEAPVVMGAAGAVAGGIFGGGGGDGGPDVIQLAATLGQPRPGSRFQPPQQKHLSPIQLRMMVRDRLISDGIQLSSPPYTSPTVRPVN